MRVAVSVPLYPPVSLVGAWVSTHQCLTAVVAAGHTVDVVPYMRGQGDQQYGLDGVQVRPGLFFPEVAYGADLILSHLGDDQQASTLAKEMGIPSVRMVHGRPMNGHTLDDDLAVFNSHTLAALAKWDGPQIVVHPPVDPDMYRVTPGTHTTLVNMSDDKGGYILWSMARRMLDLPFLAVRGSYGTQVIQAGPNVEVVAPTFDIAGQVYARTRVLLMPSKHETWGRTGVEAAVSGIPTIAHPTPGLVESLGDAGIFVDRKNLMGWCTELRRLQDPDEWAEASAKARARAAELDPAPDLARFIRALEATAARVTV